MLVHHYKQQLSLYTFSLHPVFPLINVTHDKMTAQNLNEVIVTVTLDSVEGKRSNLKAAEFL